ncbi:hypothetical protein [Agaribacterium sp. ZY112]
MKSDALTAAAVVFVIGLLISGFSVAELFSADADDAPTELQRGFQVSLKR